MKNTWLSWSTGKDSAYALAELMKSNDYEVTGLFTTVTEEFNRVAMHSTREALLEAQSHRLDIALRKVKIPHPCTNDIYEAKMRQLIDSAKKVGVECIAFGDLYLEDIRAYRERQFENTGIEPVFPLWGLSTKKLAEDIIQSGFKAILTCVDPKQLDGDFSGRKFDKKFLDSLPDKVDPCGENGEFHTFVYDGPIFSSAIPINTGEKLEREGFIFCDILPARETKIHA